MSNTTNHTASSSSAAAAKRPRGQLHAANCLRFVQALWDADTLGMFHHPVRASELPGYAERIAHPMDLSTIRGKIEKAEYARDADVESDVAIMIANALEYNDPDSPWYDLARRFRKLYRRAAEDAGLELDADAAYIPRSKAKDDETTLRRAEQRGDEELSAVIHDLAQDKETPIEVLRAKYAHARDGAADTADAPNDSKSSSSEDEDEDDDEDDEDEGDDDDEDDEDDDEDDDDEDDSDDSEMSDSDDDSSNDTSSAN